MSGDADRARERGLDSRLAAIAGEASEQRVPADRATSEGAPPFDVWHRGPSERVSSEAPTYYDRPVVKEPTWIWTVPAYFFSGGAAGASAVLAGVAWAIDADANRTLVNRARWLAAAGTGIGSVFLIADLGRPERFLNMLRVLRSSSPMSVGSWTLAACGGASAAALLEPLGGALGLLGQAAGVASAMTGPPLAAYPAVLVSNTAVPLWRSVRRSLPALFVASAASSAASILQLTVRADRDRGVLRTYAAMGLAAEIVASEWVQREANAVPRVGSPLHEGTSGALWRLSKVAAVAALVATLFGRSSAVARRTGAAVAIAGSVAMRFAIWHAGRMSARDPRATFEQGSTNVRDRSRVDGSRTPRPGD